MNAPHQPRPGISRTDRISNIGLQRLEKQLLSGAGISDPVLRQWICRYGEEAENLILASGRKLPSIDLD